MTNEKLVCPECGSDYVGTRERAEIWQPAEFTRLSEGDEGKWGSGHEDARGNKVEVEWEAYDSDDVGDTETVGFFCSGCRYTWGEEGSVGAVPFFTVQEFEAKTRTAAG
jgi:hypothetical protein